MKKSILIPFLLFLISLSVFSQDFKGNIRSLVTDTGASPSDYISYIEGCIQKLSLIRNSSKPGFIVMAIKNDLPETDTTLKILQKSLKFGQFLDVRDLQMYQILVSDVQKKLAGYKKDLDSASKRINSAAAKMEAMKKDTTWQELRKDTSARRIFAEQLKELRKKWRITDSTLRAGTKTLDEISIHVVNNAIVTAELQDRIDNQIRKLSHQTFTKEQNFLWEKKKEEQSNHELRLASENYYRAEKEAVLFYVKESSGVRFFMLLAGVLFYIWINRNFKMLSSFRKESFFEDLNIKYISRKPFIPALVVVLNLSPLFDLTPPAVFITFMQFLLMLVLSLVFYTKWPKSVFIKWISLIVLYLLLLTTHLISSGNVLVRYWFLLLSVASIIFGIFFFIEQLRTHEFPKYVRWVNGMFILFNVLSIIFNLTGRWTLAQLFSTSAVFGLAQIIGLSIFIQIFIEAFTINIHKARILNGLSEDFDFRPFMANIRKSLIYLSLVLWIMVLASNLNIYNFLYDHILSVLTKPRNIGNITFNIGSILLFFVIIWISGILQKYISYLFGDTGEEISKVNKKQHSKLLLARLVLLTAGFLLAVAASGLPVDKITIILGALGVGIGLGLQNIVNNFVSGVILIFERPFQVGDAIEIGPRKGKVREIGIRHSILLTPEGGEVIVPNGDMLSNQIMNWTLSNNYIRIEIPMKIEAVNDWKQISDTIRMITEEDQRVLPSREPAIVLNNISGNVVDFKVLIWCRDFNVAESLRSDLIREFYKALKSQNVELK